MMGMRIARAGSSAPLSTKKGSTQGRALFVGAGDGNRTRTMESHAPQTCASASSATPAGRHLLYNILFHLSTPFLKKVENFFAFLKMGEKDGKRGTNTTTQNDIQRFSLIIIEMEKGARGADEGENKNRPRFG